MDNSLYVSSWGLGFNYASTSLNQTSNSISHGTQAGTVRLRVRVGVKWTVAGTGGRGRGRPRPGLLTGTVT